MKQIKFFAVAFAAVAILSACDNSNTNPNFPVVANVEGESDHHGKHGEHDAHDGATKEKATGSFGAKIDEVGAIPAAEVVKQLESKDSVVAKVSAPITAACQKKGCWMTVDADGKEIQVSFKDYGFFVPKNSAGHTAVMEGVARKEELSVATLKHYAEDEGKSKKEIAAIIKPETKYTFEATGVIIK